MAAQRRTIELRGGVCPSGQLYRDDSGVVYGSLATAAVEYAGLLAEHLPGPVSGDGVFVSVPAGVDAGIFVVMNLLETGLHEEDSSTESAIFLGEGSSVVMHYGLRNDSEVKTLSEKRMVVAGRGSQIRIEEYCLGGGGDIFLHGSSTLAAGSRSEVVTAVFKEGNTGAEYTVDLDGPDCDHTHKGIFLIGNAEKADFNIRVNHLKPDCRSDVMVKGVAGGNSFGTFTGMVYVAQDAQHTEAYQQSRNLLLSDGARILTSPQLEIYADDVRCSHGATVGQLDGDAVYYMRQRGLSELQARSLQLTGFVNDILDSFGDEVLREELLSAADKKIGGFAADALL